VPAIPRAARRSAAVAGPAKGSATIRQPVLADVPALKALEDACFETDRLSARSFRHLLTRANAALLVDDDEGRLRGYSLTLFHRNTALARLYSFGVDPTLRRRGIGNRLMDAAERDALRRGATHMRLEVRRDNAVAIAFYQRRGYRQFSIYTAYYEDHMDAVRLEKLLAPRLPPENARVPYYPQTLEFTCGPACLMMAMKALDPSIVFGRDLETRLWRESTTIFMTAGHGGCGPLGLALAAWRRGFKVEVRLSGATTLFVNSVRSAEKREVIRLVHRGFLRDLAATDVSIGYKLLSVAQLARRLDAGAVPLVLISSYRLTGDKAPHWVVVTAIDDRLVYIHDPYVDADSDKTETDCMGLPIRHDEFARMMRYGRGKHFAALVVGRNLTGGAEGERTGG
jgi:ribosomal protein S18 acetylase RimI-like enzyme